MKKLSSLFTAISLALVCSALYAPSASPQAGRVLQSFDDLLRAGARNAPKFIRRSYRIIKTEKVRNRVFKTAFKHRERIYESYIDCQQGLASENLNDLPQDQRFSFVRDICGKF